MPALPLAMYPRQVTADDVNRELGPFDELTPIGDSSGSGECWVARTGATRDVLKIIVREHEPGRFEREVAALARIDSPRVMRVHDRGDITTPAGTFPYLRSEFVPGGSLRERLTAGPAPADDEIRAFLLELLGGLAELNDAGIVHRDLKPPNIILRDGLWNQPVIIDLGLSRLLDATTLTVYPWMGGTWPYMAPEQLRMERATHLSDVWATAVIAAEVAIGIHPFRRRGENALPADWDARLRAGPVIPGARPAALADWIAAGANYRAYRRPNALRSAEQIEAAW